MISSSEAEALIQTMLAFGIDTITSRRIYLSGIRPLIDLFGLWTYALYIVYIVHQKNILFI